MWSESSLGAFWIAMDAKFLHANNEDFEQADLSLRWAHMLQGTFYHVVVKLRFDNKQLQLFESSLCINVQL